MSSAEAGRGFARAPGRSAVSAATLGSSPSGTPKSRRRSKPPSRASSSTFAGASSLRAHRPKRATRFRHDRSLKRSAGARQIAFIAPCESAVAAAERLRHRVRQEEPALGRAPCPHASRLRGAASAPRGRSPSRDDRRKPACDQPRADRRVLARARVERLGAVGERVHRGADGLLARETERERGLVDDADGVRARSRRVFAPSHSSRMPKYGVHSDPAYVVGTATSGRPVAADTALAVSIALPPPSPTRPSRSAAAVGRRRDDVERARAAARR